MKATLFMSNHANIWEKHAMNRILALAVAILAAGFAVHCHGAQIEWDSVVLSQYANWNQSNDTIFADLELYYPPNPNSFWAILGVVAQTEGDQTRITAKRTREMEYWVNSGFAGSGDIVDESATPHLALGSASDFGTDDPESILVPTGAAAVFYLVFTGEMFTHDEIYYGWIGMEFSDSEFKMLHSAVTHGGDPLVVGLLPVPEPGTFCLCVIGACVLSLMRHMRNMR